MAGWWPFFSSVAIRIEVLGSLPGLFCERCRPDGEETAVVQVRAQE